MKKIVISSLVLLISIILSCSKTSNIQISPDNLIVCPKNSKCSYLFTEQADVDSVFHFKTGPYRLFWSSVENDLGSCKLTSILWIKAAMNEDKFSLGAEDIKNGLVKYSQTCNWQPADQTKWLLEADIVLGTINDGRPVDTLHVKQFFYPNFIYN